MKGKTLHLLILEDSPDDAELAVKELERQGFIVEWSRVETEKAFQEAINKNPDLILADYSLPSFDGMSALKMQQKMASEIPLIIISGKIGEEVAVKCIKSGATDYVLKDRLFRLGPVVKRALEEAQEHQARKRAEEALRKAYYELEIRVKDRTAQLRAVNEELKAFVYSVSHDLRAPLRAIDGFSKILLEDYRDTLDRKGQHYLRRIRVSVQNMNRLIDDLLGLSRIGRRQMNRRMINLENVVKRAYNLLEDVWKDRKVNFTVHRCPPVFADPHLMQIVFVNLLSNALKFTRDCVIAEIEVGYKRKDNRTVFFLRDNGIGFDMKYANRLFTLFQRLHHRQEYEGTGIGLAIVQRIIHRHGGQIWAESAPGSGATFYFTLQGRNHETKRCKNPLSGG